MIRLIAIGIIYGLVYEAVSLTCSIIWIHGLVHP